MLLRLLLFCVSLFSFGQAIADPNPADSMTSEPILHQENSNPNSDPILQYESPQQNVDPILQPESPKTNADIVHHHKKPASKTTGKTFIFNPRTLSWHAYQNGNLIRAGRASGGRSYCPDIRRSCRTIPGTFRIISKGSPSCRSTRFPVGRGGAPMPYCMFYSRYYAVHGSPDVPNYNASHGCIRVTPRDAQWLSHYFIDIGTKVIVKPY
jgi:lipoprotein-anchoring transpeptidase ErfK/SrfK